MFKYEKDYLKVERYRKTHPDATLTSACKACKVQYSSYYAGARAKLPKKAEPKYEKVVTPTVAVATRAGIRCVIIQGSADEVRETLRGLQ